MGHNGLTDIIYVLHVDDEEAFLKATKIYVEESTERKIKVDSLINPELIFRRLEEKAYDAIVADYQMPAMDGLQLLEQLREKNIIIPFIILTGRGREEVAIKALNLGANRYIKKGMDIESQFEELIHAIQDIVHHKRTQDALQKREEELKRNGEQLEKAINSLSHPFYVIDANDYTIQLMNTAAKKLYGEFTQHITCYKLTHNESKPCSSKEHLCPLVEVIKTKKSCTTEHHHIDVDNVRTYELVCNPIFDQKGNVIQVIEHSMDITEKKQAEKVMKTRLKLEQLVARLSSDFVNLPLEEMDQMITRALKEIAEFAGAVRSSIFLFSEDLQTVTNTHEWCENPDNSQIAQLQNIPSNSFGYYWELLQQKKNVIISFKTDLPPEAESEWEWIREHGWQSLLFVPMVFEGKLYGTLGFYGEMDEERQWFDDLVYFLLFVATLVTNTFERKKAEKDIQESEEKYRSFVENFQGIAFRGYEDFSVDLFRGNIEEITGYTEDDFITGKIVFDQLIHPEDIPRINSEVTDFVSSSRRSTEREYRIIDKNGKLRWIQEYIQKFYDEARSIGGVYGTIQEITTRKQAEEALKESEERFRLLGENVAVGLWIIQEDKFIYGNDSFFEIIGFPREEILGSKPSELNKEQVYPEDLAFVQEQFQKKISEEKNGIVPRYQYRWYTKNNLLKWIEVISKPIIYHGKPAILGAIIDISEQKNTEKDLLSINKELQDCASIIVHDLKAPLRNMKTIVEWLLRDSADDLSEEGKDHLASLIRQTTLMDTLIKGIYQYSKIDRLKKEIEKINLNELLSEVIEIVSPPDNIEIAIQTEKPILAIDRTHLIQIFTNLLDNAVKFMDKPKGHIIINHEEKETFWQFSVRDNGPGIEERHFKRIFKMFQTLSTKEEAKGTGVGLAIVKKVVEMNGGKIWLESTVGEGSTFFFTLLKE